MLCVFMCMFFNLFLFFSIPYGVMSDAVKPNLPSPTFCIVIFLLTAKMSSGCKSVYMISYQIFTLEQTILFTFFLSNFRQHTVKHHNIYTVNLRFGSRRAKKIFTSLNIAFNIGAELLLPSNLNSRYHHLYFT